MRVSAEMSKNAGTSDFIGLTALPLLNNISGAVLAIVYVGQRDTSWLTPLTVSGWRQGEEGASQISSACSYPTAASAFYFSRLFSATRLPQMDDQIKSAQRLGRPKLICHPKTLTSYACASLRHFLRLA